MIFPSFTSEPIEESNGVFWFSPRENYASPFGKQWEIWSGTQLDSQTNLPLSTQRLRRVFGPLWEGLGDLSVLEVGCGAGRFTEVLLSRGATVTAVDISSAIEVCAASFGSSSRFRAVGASATSLPFSHGQFDVVVCLGVIQHTPEPRRTIESLWEQVRPGGFLVVDQYRHSLNLASNYLGVQIFLEAAFSESWNQFHKHACENPFASAQARSREEISGVALESLISDHIPLFDLAAI